MVIIERLDKFITKCDPFKFFSICFLILITKTGISPIGVEYVDWLRDSAQSYPEVIKFVISSPASIVSIKLLNYPSVFIWWGFCLVLYIIWLVITYFGILTLSRKKNLQANHLTLIFFCIPASHIQITMIGHSDIFTLLGATIIFLTDFKYRVFIGSLIAISGNMDQAIAATVCLGFLTLGKSPNAKRIFKTWSFLAILSYFLLHLSHSIPINEDPKFVMFTDLGGVLKTSIPMWHFIIFGQFGIYWIFLIINIYPYLKSQLHVNLLYFTGGIFIPIGMSFFILDGNRVGVCGTYVVTLTVLMDYLNKTGSNIFEKSNLKPNILFLIFIIYPPVNVGNLGHLRIPLEKYFSLLG